MARTPRRYRDVYELAPPNAGLTLVMATAVAVNVLAFFDFSKPTVVLVLTLAAIGLVGGLAFHLRVRSAWRRRSERQRQWLSTQPSTDLLDFRAKVLVRERELEQARQGWVLPLCAALTVTVSAVVVPYEMVGAFAPDALVEPLNSAWATLAIATGLFCAALSVLAGRHQERASGRADILPFDPDRHVDA